MLADLKFVRFDPDHDYIDLLLLLTLRDKKCPLESLPKEGVMAYVGGIPVAAGFLRLCEGKMGLLDSFITNPEQSGDMRHRALDGVYLRLLERAKNLGVTLIVAFSVDNGTLARAKRHGFEELPQVLMALKLEGKA